MGRTGTGTGRVKVTRLKPVPVPRVWRVWFRRDNEGFPLLATSKMGERRDEEGIYPPRRVENECNKHRETPYLLHRRELRRDEQGSPPTSSCRVEKGCNVARKGQPLLATFVVHDSVVEKHISVLEYNQFQFQLRTNFRG